MQIQLYMLLIYYLCRSIQYTDVDNDQGFWMFPSNQAIVNGDVIYLPGNNAIADT